MGPSGRRPRPPYEPPEEPGVPKKPAAPKEPEVPFKEVDFRIPDEKPLYYVGVRYPRGERLLGPLHYFYTVDPEPTKVECVIVPHYVHPCELLALLELNQRRQFHVLVLQGIAIIAFLLAFQVLLLKVPRHKFARVRLGWIPIPFFRRRKKKEEESKMKRGKEKKIFSKRKI